VSVSIFDVQRQRAFESRCTAGRWRERCARRERHAHFEVHVSDVFVDFAACCAGDDIACFQGD
jgi:hypothetical protein